MFLNLLIATSSSLFLALLVILAKKAINSRLALARCKKLLKGFPFLEDGASLFGNHLSTMIDRRNLQVMDRLHKKHGSTYAYAIHETPIVSTCDLSLIKQVVLDKANTNINRIQLGIPMREIEQDCIFTCVGDQWRRIRRAFAPALKSARFKTPNVIGEIELAINKLLDAIDKKLDEEQTQNNDANDDNGKNNTIKSTTTSNSRMFNVEDLIRRYSLQLVLSCLYKQYNTINFNLNEQCHWVEMVDMGLREMRDNVLFRIAVLVPELRHIIDWLSYNFHPIGEWRHKVLTFIKQQSMQALEARKEFAELKAAAAAAADDNNNEQTLNPDNFKLKDGTQFVRNMTDFIVDQFHAGKLTKDEYFHSSFLLFGAADKTASDAIVNTLYHLGVHQDVQKKLRQSVRAQGIESEYLTWIINESLRLNPPVGIGCSRTIVESIEVELDDGDHDLDKRKAILPAGTIFFTPTFTIHRNKKYWGEDAELYKPERWAESASFHPAQFIPFGAALRGCPGREFAMFEMKKLISSLVLRYHFECQIKEDLLEFDSPLYIFNLNDNPLMMNIRLLNNRD